jgi:hypothetical protein
VAGASVPVVIVTHEACERDIVAALAQMDGMSGIGKGTVKMRIEE